MKITQLAIEKSIRHLWNVNPVEKKIASKKIYNRKKMKQDWKKEY